ncbi:hypothetical protein OG455_17775 [Kitasatospora sp. NBC_01287]|uniref:hypothetical protein n=1 Tax=Kitasatospora sp. NBC_01287 TaxID=2903573 RepID=UPI002254B8E3|nr:hypothetical protein [Kitasatospora sp. NBC_01287]MCX4747348.1 hypothetical protein [Kitasatospora sp. NBC_01287]
MSEGQGTIGAVGLRLALRCYPRRYRVERGAEIAEVFADTTEAAGRFARARELYGVAAYGIRLRLGLTSSRPAGRLFGTAAPLVVGTWAGVTLLWLLIVDESSPGAPLGLFSVLWYAQSALSLPVLVAALLDRWTVVRFGALLAVAAAVLVDVRWLHYTLPSDGELSSYVQWALERLAPLVWPLLLLAAPRDRLDLGLHAGRVGRASRRWAVLALTLGVGIVAIGGSLAPLIRNPLTSWAELGGALALVLVTVAVLRRGALSLAVLVPAGLSLLAPINGALLGGRTPNGELTMLPLALAALVELRRRSARAGAGVPLG